MHKDPAGMRWIAGCARQEIDHQGDRIFEAPATSISPTASALGAILRFCMTQLERKDIEKYRPLGIRRYWIVTAVDAVARHIKTHQKELAKEEVFTEDFTTMYTKLPPDKIKTGVGVAIKEAFDFFDPKATFSLKWARDGSAEVVFDSQGIFTQVHVLSWVQHVVDGTFIKPSADTPTLKQVVGVPMGGKCSSELANLYCYSVESATIDQLIAQNAMDVVKSLYHTFRFIDDILSFGKKQLHLFDYGMEHRQTNEDAHHAVFLGMAIDTSGDFVQLKMQPKGAGWKWVPQRYVEWTSVHTSATKNFMLKGLLVRAGTITNTLPAFHEAIEYYVQGLHARGFTRKALHNGFQSYIHDHWNAFPHQQHELSNWFQMLIKRIFGPTNHPPQPTQQSIPAQNTNPGNPTKGALLCGLDAINSIMINQGKMPIQRDIVDDIADNVATWEAIVDPQGDLAAPDQEGNYHITVITIALKQFTDLFVNVWTPNGTSQSPPVAYVLGNGFHWQAVVQEADGWFLRDKKSFKIHNLKHYLTVASRRGVVLALSKELPPNGDMDWEGTAPNRKRDHQEVTPENLPNPVPPTTTTAPTPPSQIIIADDDEDEPEKKSRALQDDSQDTQVLLQNAPQAFEPLPSDTPPNVTTRSANSQAQEPQWQPITIGVTAMFFCEATAMYKCNNCNFQSLSGLGVASHFGKYCNKNSASNPPKEETEEEDIL